MTAPEFTQSKFWRLIETIGNESSGDLESRSLALIEELLRYSPEEIHQCQKVLEEIIALADRWELRAAAHIINRESSEEGFLEFRGWLIAQGKSVFDEALNDPESLVDVVESEVSCGPFLNAPRNAYLKKTGNKMPPHEPLEVVPTGEEWIEAELPEMFPKLWTEFSDEDDY